MWASYSPEDNKLRLYPDTNARLSKDEYNKLRSLGFIWAPRQKLFVALAWSPQREDLLLEMCGAIEDEDTSLVERASDRSERFSGYGKKRSEEATRAKASVDALADNIPLGQPILVGHHSERHARKDAEKIQNGMNRAIKLWDTAEYWKRRAAGAIAAAKYKERPDVRYRRIKGLESILRKEQKERAELEANLKLWTDPDSELTRERALAITNRPIGGGSITIGEKEYWSVWSALDNNAISPEDARDHSVKKCEEGIAYCDRWIRHIENRLAYEKAMLGESGGIASDKWEIQIGGRVLVKGEWLMVLKINKTGGKVSSLTTNRRCVSKVGIEAVTDYKPPEEGAAAKIKAAMKLPPLCNYPGEGFIEMTKADWDRSVRNQSATTRIMEATEQFGRHRYRSAISYGGRGGLGQVFITDIKRVDPPAPEQKAKPVIPGPTLDAASILSRPNPVQPSAIQAEFAALKETAKAGVQVVVAHQLFETSKEVARKMVEVFEVVSGRLVPGCRILEPQGGTGALIRAAVGAASGFDCCRVVTVEINQKLVEGLERMRQSFLFANEKNFQIIQGDFLECGEELGLFDIILMNPPFENGMDIKHIKHARRFLKPNGMIVALCANGPRQQAELKNLAVHWEDLPEGSFKEQGTNVHVALLALAA